MNDRPADIETMKDETSMLYLSTDNIAPKAHILKGLNCALLTHGKPCFI